MGAKPLAPEVQRILGGDAELERVDHPRPGATAGCAGELEPGQDRARGASLVAEVQVVRLRRVEVDGLLDEPQAEDAGIEVDVSLRVAGDHRDVVKGVEPHRRSEDYGAARGSGRTAPSPISFAGDRPGR